MCIYLVAVPKPDKVSMRNFDSAISEFHHQCISPSHCLIDSDWSISKLYHHFGLKLQVSGPFWIGEVADPRAFSRFNPEVETWLHELTSHTFGQRPGVARLSNGDDSSPAAIH